MAANKKGSKASQKRTKKQTPSDSLLSEQHWFYLAMACAVCSILLYYNTIQNDFVFDDSAAVVQNPDVRGESPLLQLFQNDFWATPLDDPLSHKSYRPITTLTYRMTARLHGMEPMPFHFYNILLNAIACYMIVYCVKCISGNNSCIVVPVVTCVLFSFHPIHTEVVATVVGRADLLSAIFALAAFLYHSQCMKESSTITSKPFLYCLVLAWLSALSKETGLMILGICGAHEVARIWLPRSSDDFFKSMTRFCMLALTGVAYLLFRKIINGPSTGIMPSEGDNPLVTSSGKLQYALTAAHIMVVYMWRLVNPFVLLCDYGYNVVPLVEGWSDARNLATLALVIGVVMLGVVAVRNKNGRLLMALAWIFIPLLPASHVLILGTVVAERLLFLPSLGYCMLVALGVERMLKRYSQHKNAFLAVFVIVLALFTSRIMTRNQEWSMEEKLWKADYESHPQNVKISMNRAKDLHQANDYDAAWNIVKDLKGLGDVQRFELCTLSAKATALSKGNDFDKAYQIMDKCVEKVNARKHPSQNDHLVFSAYGYLLSQQERHEEAAVWFNKASESAESVGANAVGPVCNEGEILARLGKWTESVPVLKKCAELSVRAREQDDNKLMNLAKAYYMSRDFDEAEQVLLNDLPQNEEALHFLETVRTAKKQREEWKKRKEEESTTT